MTKTKLLKDCNIGEKVRVYCIGWRDWDDRISEVVEIDSNFAVKIRYKNGTVMEFVPDTPCLVIE